ncbi:MAG: 1-acyl-sn-glycerol-3-phosphate acyltransferase [Pseudomonadales bacterium]|nr:1-acyl-sn-glycerol-3-phosphate acyltransferase [Pseudomonadales bacterium]
MLQSAVQNLPENRPLIFVANHHSSIDILLLMHYLTAYIGSRKLRFISRPQLDRNIPGVSFYLRRYCYSLGQHQKKSPDRKSDRAGMADFARQVAWENGVLVIFPEGVKARGIEEHTRPFYRSGLKTLLEQMPNALVVPVSLAGSGCFYTTPRKPSDIFKMPPNFAVNIGISILPAVDVNQYESIDAVVDHCEFVISRDYQRQTESGHSVTPLSPEGSHPSA